MLAPLAIFAAGFWAGMINVVVGSGTLVTFPTLVLFGYPPLVANVSNNIGLVGGGITGTWGYRRELTGQAGRLRQLLPASCLGGLTGALLLLVLPASAFRAVVPVLIALGLLMVVAGPALQRRAAARRARPVTTPVPYAESPATPTPSRARNTALIIGTFLLGIYGGYFGAAQGVLIIGLMSVLTAESLQSITGLKNVLTTAVNALAAVTFMLVAWHSVDWAAVALIAAGATLGGVAGARFGRRLPPALMRALIVLIGLVAIARLLFFP
ncbi:sulfite exporter TauE/SafE family protein [Couchioplanes caeruleus]|uniref:sulfite exporter TauE/SafE family protein n=1 Tax=Couchioplanes caeruleus TaxID=56438 RepID=UPI0020BF6896|nr:sulfite exporter TauE/SafE family protein [Couchioplanes caeruleus]UQU63945.1 sulfite exporter TauE/SafE family protein [Couchioplanes caeruleus]